MNTFYIKRHVDYNILKQKKSSLASSKIQRIFKEHREQDSEFMHVDNLVHFYFTVDTAYSKLYSDFMNKKAFETRNLVDSKTVFEEYEEFNKDIARELLVTTTLGKDDLVIVHDHDLLLIGKYLPCKVAMRNVCFDSFFLYRVPFYEQVIEAMQCTNVTVFFKEEDHYNAFNRFLETSYDFEQSHNGVFIEKYINKKKMLEIIEGVKCKENEKNRVVLDTKYLLDAETLIESGNQNVFYLIRIEVDFNEEIDRLIQYYQKSYRNLTMKTISNTDQLIKAFMQQNTVYVGTEYDHYAKQLGIKMHNLEYKHELLSMNDESITKRSGYVLNELEYVKLFGYYNKCTFDIENEEEMEQKQGRAEIRIKEAINGHVESKGDFEQLRKSHSKEIGSTCARNPKEARKLTDGIIAEMRGINRILLDYDGTLREIEKNPLDAVPTEEILQILQENSDRIVLCTGRSREICEKWFPIGIQVYAEHGGLFRDKSGKWKVSEHARRKLTAKEVESLEMENRNESVIHDNIADILKYYAKRTPGCVLEKKEMGYAFHYRNVDLQSTPFVIRHLFRDLAKVQRIYNFLVTKAKMNMEVKMASKKDAVDEIDPMVVAGDDVTDEDMFMAANSDCYTIKVGMGKTWAKYHVEDTSELLEKLRLILGLKQ
ncbi:TPP [Enterospora canceri]|uniref:TPP n=1 Tax=Enterospora canceri TaxID=1081671 RepID=A0A1Y1S773_9MICR|nr:TPP [Enterospora canceri]